MSKKRRLSIQTSSEVVEKEVSVVSVVSVVSDIAGLNRYLAPHVKYAFDEFVNKNPDKVNKLIAYANLSDEALLGYVKTLIVPEVIIKETEEE